MSKTDADLGNALMDALDLAPHGVHAARHPALLGMAVYSCPETPGNPVWLLKSHCGEEYALYRLDGSPLLFAKRTRAGRFPILNVKTDRFDDRGGPLRLVGR